MDRAARFTTTRVGGSKSRSPRIRRRSTRRRGSSDRRRNDGRRPGIETSDHQARRGKRRWSEGQGVGLTKRLPLRQLPHYRLQVLYERLSDAKPLGSSIQYQGRPHSTVKGQDLVVLGRFGVHRTAKLDKLALKTRISTKSLRKETELGRTNKRPNSVTHRNAKTLSLVISIASRRARILQHAYS